MPDEPLMVTVTGPEGYSLRLPVRDASDAAGIEADLLISGSCFIRNDAARYLGTLGIGIPEMLDRCIGLIDSTLAADADRLAADGKKKGK